jgi:hypothetical protein
VTEPTPPDHVTLAVLCDRCEAQLVVEGCDRDDARTKLRAAITDAHWHVVDRLGNVGDVADMAALTGKASSTTPRTPDLCDACAKVLL